MELAGVDFKENRSYSAVNDDGFKLWSTAEGWIVVYCLPISDYDVDYCFWTGREWSHIRSKAGAGELNSSTFVEAVSDAWLSEDRLRWWSEQKKAV